MTLTSDDLVVHHLDEPLVLYRIVKGATHGHPGVIDSLRSNYERAARPRGLEAASALVQMGLSMYVARDLAIATAMRWPRIGAHVAEMRLEASHGFGVAATGQRGHMTVWGRPLQLLACVADILTVGAS